MLNSFTELLILSKMQIIIFELKNDGKKWPRIYFEIVQCKQICPERLNWPGRLAGISEGARGISKKNLDHFSSSFLS